jgi:hypothetical protein
MCVNLLTWTSGETDILKTSLSPFRTLSFAQNSFKFPPFQVTGLEVKQIAFSFH